MTPLEQRLKELEERLSIQAEEFTSLQKSVEPTESNVRSLKKELSDLKRAVQITPATPSRAQPVVIWTASASGSLPTDVEKAIASRLAGLSSSDDLYKALGLIRKPYGA
jgi:uncharacterized coiled-coil protein SlyX